MREHFLRLARQTAVYGIGAVAQQMLGVVTLPVYARVFDPAQYGVVEVITVGLSVLAIFVDLGLGSASQRSYYDYSEEQADERRLVLSSSIGPSMAIALAIAAALAVANTQVSELVFSSSRYGSTVILAGLSVPALTLATLLREVMRLRFQPWRYLTAALIAGGVGSLLSVGLVLGTGIGINGVFLGALVGNVLAAGYALWIVHPHIGRRISRRELRVMLAYGLPLIPSAIAMWALQFVDRILLTKLASLSEVGEYAIANRLSLALMMLVSAFGVAYSPFMLSLHRDDPAAELQVRARLLTYLTAALVALSVVLSVFAREIVSVLAPGFHTAYESVALVCAGTVALGFSQVAMAGIALTRRTRLFAIYASVAAVVNLGLNFALIPIWGQVGAAAATAIGYVLLAVLYYRGAQRVYPTPYSPRRLIAVSALGAALMPVGLLGDRPLALDLAAKVGALVVLAAGLRLSGAIGRAELAQMREITGRARAVRAGS
ncbi:MAG TPA: oligosaccharide flippase family protein [Solirubrobacteraceae bacterium]|nr:oligosaccharide flippase family protein [Solirubrobacteraceae bacterium]